VAYQAKSLGMSRCDGGDMPVVAQLLRDMPTLAILFFAETATSLWSIFHAMVVRPLAYRSHNSAIYQMN
jgi:hypothetical protein